MFEKAGEMISDALNDMKISMYENSHPVDESENFDDDFYNWTNISTTYSDAGQYYFTYK